MLTMGVIELIQSVARRLRPHPRTSGTLASPGEDYLNYPLQPEDPVKADEREAHYLLVKRYGCKAQSNLNTYGPRPTFNTKSTTDYFTAVGFEVSWFVLFSASATSK